MNRAEAHLDLLGKTVKDKVTGYTGVVVSVCFDLFGCIQAAVKPPVDKDGKIGDGYFIDVNRLVVTSETRVMPVPEWEAPAWGDKPETHKHGPADKPRHGAL